jgi:hypothetical protein
MIALIVPPFPAVSLPSNTTQTFAAEAFTHACIATSSPCSRRNSCSCCFLFILACGSACAASAVAVWPSPSTSSRRLVFLATSTPFGETSTRHTVPEARSAARGDRGAANDPRQHLPEGQSMADPTLACSAPYGREPDFEGPPRLLSSVRSGYRLGRWDAAGRNIGRSVGAGPVPNTHRCIDQAGRTHVWRRIITERCRGGSVSDAGDRYCCQRRRVAGGAAGSWDGTGSHALGVRHRRPPPSRLAGGADSREEWAVSTGNGDH